MAADERRQVIIRNYDNYDVPTIRTIIRDGLRQMKLHPYRKRHIIAISE